MFSRASWMLILVLGLPAASLPGQPLPEVALRIFVLGDPARQPPGLVKELRESKRFEVRPEPGTVATLGEHVRWADAILVLSVPTDADEAWVRKLDAALESGAGLVVGGDAVSALEDSVAYSSLLGRDTGPAPAVRPRKVVVARQSHPVTQCLTHFVHSGDAQRVLLEGSVLASGSVSAPPPEAAGGDGLRDALDSRALRQSALVWTHRREKVVVSALDLARGPSVGAARTILFRGLEWVTSRRIRVPLAEPYLLSSALRALSLTSAGAYRPGQPIPPERLALEGGFTLRGRFFMGRQCAPVMTYHGADWLIRPDREKTEQPDRVLAALGIQPGSTAVDLGAGNGYFSLRMARLVGEKGRVLAVDIQPEMLELLKERASEAGISNIECVLAKEDDPGLTPESADLVLLVDVYHELATPQEVLSRVWEALKPKGRLVLVEYRGEDPTVAIKPLHRMLLPQIRAELAVLGFDIDKVHEFLPNQRIVVAGKRPRP